MQSVEEKIIVKEWSKGNDVKYLDSIPGITPFLAATLLAELLPLERFKTIDQIVAFSGLDPSVKQTGGKADITDIFQREVPPTLREALFLACLRLISERADEIPLCPLQSERSASQYYSLYSWQKDSAYCCIAS